ncbi:MAG: glycosyltransferase [Flavobacteriales bacterium]|nr:glycosyltransferase [Flavobacteriales bacterium]
MEAPLISIIMPAYNAGRYISEAIASVLAQDTSDWELIIVNDGSTDDTREAIARYTDLRIHVLHEENGGVSAARNAGLGFARGRYICFLDADDRLPAGSLAARAKVLDEEPGTSFVDGVVLPLEDERPDATPLYRPTFRGAPFGELMRLSGSCFFGPTWMIRREIIGDRRFPEHMRHAEDLAFYLSIARDGVYGSTERPVLLYRRGHGSAMSDLDGLDRGYQALFRFAQHLEPKPSEGDLGLMRRKIRRVMMRGYLKVGRPWRAMRAWFRRMPVALPKRPVQRVLFLSYWSLREPLTAAAIFPYLRILSDRPSIKDIHLVTMETTSDFLPDVDLAIPKVEHVAVLPRFKWWFLLSKVDLYLRSIGTISRLVRREGIDLIMAKASMAGAIAHFVHRRTGVPYNVESFEPHATYMVECGVWPKRGLRFLFADHMERVQLHHASNIITVTWNHARDLVREGQDPWRVHVIPSITDLERFRFQPEDRAAVRQRLGIPADATVGVYVGKFGGLYFDREAFHMFKEAFKHFPDLHLVVLSPMDPTVIEARAAEAGIPADRFHVSVAAHTEVPAHLSAADLAFSPIKPAPIKRYQCPIKNGEYWASGLPILMTDGVADEHLLMRKGIGGAVYGTDLSGLDEAFATIKRIMREPDYRASITRLAERYKSVRIAEEVYQRIL